VRGSEWEFGLVNHDPLCPRGGLLYALELIAFIDVMNHPVLDINDQVEVIAGMIADEPEAFAPVIADLSVAFTGIAVQIGIP